MEITVRRDITLQNLLECGAHFGTNTSQWHPQAARFIYCLRRMKDFRPVNRNAERSMVMLGFKTVCIIDLHQTVANWGKARNMISEYSQAGKQILIVGNKPNTKEILMAEGEEVGVHYVTGKWNPGLLTNFDVIKVNIDRYNALTKYLAQIESSEVKTNLTKKEISLLTKEQIKLHRDYHGIRKLKKTPDLVVIIDANLNHLAVNECERASIPSIGIIDTDTDPSHLTVAVPANDDSANTVALFIRASIDAVKEGVTLREATQVVDLNFQDIANPS